MFEVSNGYQHRMLNMCHPATNIRHQDIGKKGRIVKFTHTKNLLEHQVLSSWIQKSGVVSDKKTQNSFKKEVIMTLRITYQKIRNQKL